MKTDSIKPQAGAAWHQRLVRAWRQWWQRMWCKHDLEWRFNYYGDQIIYNGGNRSAWRCKKCGAWEDRPDLMPEVRATVTGDRNMPQSTKLALAEMARLASEQLARGDFDDCPNTQGDSQSPANNL